MPRTSSFVSLFLLLVTDVRVCGAGVDVTKGRREAVAWAEKHRGYAQTGVFHEEEAVDSKDYQF